MPELSRTLRVPRMAFTSYESTPREQRIIDHETVFELFMFVAIVVREPE